MNDFKKKLLSLYPTLNDQQIYELQLAFSLGVKESIILTFAKPHLSAEIMSLARSDVMDGYFVHSWWDLDFKNDELLKERERIIRESEIKQSVYKYKL